MCESVFAAIFLSTGIMVATFFASAAIVIHKLNTAIQLFGL